MEGVPIVSYVIRLESEKYTFTGDIRGNVLAYTCLNKTTTYSVNEGILPFEKRISYLTSRDIGTVSRIHDISLSGFRDFLFWKVSVSEINVQCCCTWLIWQTPQGEIQTL